MTKGSSQQQVDAEYLDKVNKALDILFGLPGAIEVLQQAVDDLPGEGK